MNFPFYIARRYLVSKKSNNAINIISIISVVGVVVGSMALIIVLSVFNGFEQLVLSLFNSFNPDIQITAKQGKTININAIPYNELKKINEINAIAEVIEENALLKYGEKQYIATVKGVSSNYKNISGIDTMIIDGRFMLQQGDLNMAVLGAGVAYNLDINLNDYGKSISIYVPRKVTSSQMDITNAFAVKNIMPGGVFSIQQEFDEKYIFVPLRFAKELFEYENKITALEISLKPNANAENVQKQIAQVLGEDYVIKNRFQQQELLYRIMKSEKWAVFIILAFILVIALFNIIGTLSMLILEKKKDVSVIWSLGADLKLIRKIFLLQGLIICVFGAVTGLVLGAVICWLQQKFGFVSIQSSGTFVVTAYPVKMIFMDFVLVLATVLLIGITASFYPVKQIKASFLQKL